MVSILARHAAAAGLVLAASACGGDEIVAPSNDEPFLYLVLNERTVDRDTPEGRVGQHALLLTAGSPAEEAEYRPAERFEMRRAADGARFGWRGRRLSGGVGSYPAVSLDHPNFSLPEAAAGAELGAGDVEPGETYELEVETRGKRLRGRVTVPASFSASLVERNGRRVAVWPRVAGAAGYRISSEEAGVRVQSDTAYVVPEGVPAGAALRIDALDPGLFTYLSDDRTQRAGIDGGFGVFGALTSGTLRS